MSDEDLRRANVEATQTVDILDFVDASKIDPMYYEKPYYLAPASPNSKKKSSVTAYVLLREALRKTGKVGIAKARPEGREGCQRRKRRQAGRRRPLEGAKSRDPEE
ncbi:Ku protein [Sorangium sp. So ce590]|uniref:Ku protein n=1 Tax=unclassified Sorangium TaxID=2621164 RepID=UPI003F5F692B